MSVPQSHITDPTQIHQIEKRLAREAKDEERLLSHAIKDAKHADKTEAYAHKAAAKADKALAKAEAKESKTEKAMYVATNKHDMAVSELKAATKDDKLKHDHFTLAQTNAQARRADVERLSQQKDLHDKAREERLEQLRSPTGPSETM